ncbi:unnamed protein product [Notodromas monacha]|uniref:RING-type domain-containing protein n=1 Tax=Notodromas monacha TaxID=399045 RepID=A0A7R9GEI2_9CRUS|nr:unnamed protein product [Notodromas monacha]CAG0919764.1 unnamed protein product [Notodromas monacha]
MNTLKFSRRENYHPCDDASTGERLMHRLCPRSLRRFFSRWLPKKETEPKSKTDLEEATSEELHHLMTKVDDLLKVHNKDDLRRNGGDQETEEYWLLQCIVCVNARAMLETYPCRHAVLCKACFLKTIQVAIYRGILPLQCVLCRSEIYSICEISDFEDEPPAIVLKQAPRSASKWNGGNLGNVLRTPSNECEFFMEMLRHPDEPSLLGPTQTKKPRRPTLYEKVSNFSNALPKSTSSSVRGRRILQKGRVSPTIRTKGKTDAKRNLKSPELLSPQEQFRYQFHEGKIAAMRERKLRQETWK